MVAVGISGRVEFGSTVVVTFVKIEFFFKNYKKVSEVSYLINCKNAKLRKKVLLTFASLKWQSGTPKILTPNAQQFQSLQPCQSGTAEIGVWQDLAASSFGLESTFSGPYSSGHRALGLSRHDPGTGDRSLPQCCG